ncbi:MAG: secretion system protein F [Chloroflexota bacterium]|nr:MAG: secretion system protein F [Chloroflexota bacterium]
MDVAVLLSCVAGVGTLLVFAGLDLAGRGRLRLDKRLDAWGRAAGPVALEDVTPIGDARGSRLSRALAGQSFADRLQRDLARANIRLTAAEFLMIQTGIVATGIATGLATTNVGAGLAVILFGVFGPRQFVGMAQRRRLNAFSNQLADTLMMMSSSLRAGYSLLQSMETVAREASEPTRSEFGRVLREVGLGLNAEDALNNLYRRMPSGDLDLMVTAINVQHEVGGNLARIFDNLSETLRERARVHGEIQTLTAQQRLGGMIIALLPVGLAGVLFVLRPTYLRPLLTSETIICMPAFALLILAAVMVVAGYLTIRRLVAIEV